MQEVLKELIAAVGGGAVVLVGVLTIFKKLFLKLFETGIESTFEKELENIEISYHGLIELLKYC